MDGAFRMYQVTFLTENISVPVEPGTTVLAAEIAAGLKPDAPCGGMGVCGKCLVQLRTESGEWITVKACDTPVDRDLTVLTAAKNDTHRILTEGAGTLDRIAPPVRAAELSVERPTLVSPTAGWYRLRRAIEAAGGSLRADPRMADRLAETLEQQEYRPEAILFRDELLCLRRSGPLLAAAVDVGTTTVVLYLADARTGTVLATRSTLNPQTEFGADVISRANYAMQHGAAPLSASIREAINDLLAAALTSAGAEADDVFSIVLVGNTCMHHLFLGLDPSSLVLSPYVPSIADALALDAADYGIRIHPRGKLLLLPCIAGFVGADTSAVMLACDFDRREELTLAIDIGTNGELVLGNKDRTLACSTAAGPAFEGAKITFGMRGAEGAIDHAVYKNGTLRYTVIGGGAPKGICGSGLLDLVAALLAGGLVDETGRLVDEDEIPPEAEGLAGRLRTVDGMRCFVLADAEEAGFCLYLSQKDIREVQLAKGAMAAGIELMLEQFGARAEDIRQVLIAGAFGNYMSPESACAIGLLPPVLLDRITPVGNAAGSGALLCALDETCLARTDAMAAKTEFIELASNPNFQDRFVDELTFPETEL